MTLLRDGYARFVPARAKKILPKSMRRALERWVEGGLSAVRKVAGPIRNERDLRNAVAAVDGLLNATGWPEDEGTIHKFYRTLAFGEIVRTIDLIAQADGIEASRLQRRLSSRLFAPVRGFSSRQEAAAVRIGYIPTSPMPSRAANNVHVMKMCGAITKNGTDVCLVFVKNAATGEIDRKKFFESYDVQHEFSIACVEQSESSGIDYYRCVCAAIEEGCTHVLTRSLAAAYFSVLAGLPTSLDLHKPIDDSEGAMARNLFRSPSFRSLVTISRALKEQTAESFPPVAAKIAVVPNAGERLAHSSSTFDFIRVAGCTFNVGYTGHLYPGKGAEIIIQLAQRLPDVAFHVLGGYEAEIEKWKSKGGGLPNIVFYGYRPHSHVANFLECTDIVIAPFLRRVIVHGGKDDHASWMSPLKIFEYMAAGKPIISSDLAVLREILVHEENALLCDPDDIESWVRSVDRLRKEPQLMRSLATAARSQFEIRHTWEKRAAAVVAPLIRKSQIENGEQLV
jgi:hypothetical protein